MEKLITTSNCTRYSNGSCLDGDFVSKCVGKDCCGAYEPKPFQNGNSSIPKKCHTCGMFSGAYCDVHQHLIEDAANCSEWTEKDCSEKDMRISVAKLREILDKCVEVGYVNEYSKHRILELVKGGLIAD